MSVTTLNKHITLNDEGVPIIRDTRTKVVQIVLDVKNGLSADEIHEQYPYLSLAQIHSALAYYYDHREEIEQDIVKRDERLEELRREMQGHGVRSILKERGAL